MRIALVTNNYTPYSGGVVSSINAYAQQLMACGHTILIITLDFLGDAHHDEPYVKRVASITHFMYKTNPMAIPWRPDAAVLRYLQEFKPDVVHVQHPFLLGQSALTAARTLSIPIVFTYHTLYEHYTHYVPLYQPWVKAIVKKRVLHFCQRVDHIIAPSSAVYEYLVSNNITTPITVMPSPVQREFFCSDARVSDFGHQPFRLLVVSRLVKEKNITAALDVMAQLTPGKYELTIVGYGEQEQALRDYVYRTLNFSEQQVRFVIHPARQELIRLYHESDLFLFTSVTDTQGLVLAESMAGSTPVIALDGPGQRDIIINGVNGFIVPSLEAMIIHIQSLAGDAQTCKKLRSGAYATAQKYRPETVADFLLTIYAQGRGILF